VYQRGQEKVKREPLRVGVVGIDGSGKSSTSWRALELLGADGAIICKPGRNAWVQRGTQREYYLPAISKFFEDFFRRADASRRRGLISASRAAFIAYQRWLEPHMIRRHRPKLVLNTRCLIIDPAIYGDFYWPRLRRVPLERKMRAFGRFSGLPFRDLYFFLRTPADVAIARIHRRIANTPGLECQPREYWLHLHESEAILGRLGDRFAEALAIARRMAQFDLVEIETTRYDEAMVAEIIATEVRRRLTARPPERMQSCA
jgi:thymidylate kinase